MSNKKNSLLQIGIVSSTFLTIASCGHKKSAATTEASAPSVSVSLQRIAAANKTGLSLVRNFGASPFLAIQPPINLMDTEIVTNNVTISSLKFPISRISISDQSRVSNSTASGNHSFDVYECSGATPDNCLVDLTGDALTNLLKNATPLKASEGTFSSIRIDACNSSNQSPTLKLTATAELKTNPTDTTTTTYYTNAVNGLSATGPAEEVTIPTFCGGASFFLLKDLVIGSGKFTTAIPSTSASAGASTSPTPAATPTPAPILTDTIPLQLYFDIANVATASGGTSNSGAGKPSNGCFGVDSQHPYICLNFPDVVATVDTTVPTVKRFLVQDTGTSPIFQPMIFGLYFGSDTTVPFGMYSRPYYDGGNRPTTETLIGAAFSPFSKNADETINITTITNWMTIEGFKLATHTGNVVLDKKDDPAANPTSKLNGTEPYSATLLP